jgi:hypothetical protein
VGKHPTSRELVLTAESAKGAEINHRRRGIHGMEGVLSNREILEILEIGRETERGPSSSLLSKGG